ncbi:MAG: hypothetical protein ACXV95_01010 [Acidimicrobiales bacterium]
MNRKIIAGIGVSALLLLSTACGGATKKDDQAVAGAEKPAEPAGDTSSTSTSTTAGPSTTTSTAAGDTTTTAAGTGGPSGTDADFAAQANALCGTFNDQVSAVPQPTETTPAALGAYLDQAMALLDQQIAELKTLSPPASVSAPWAKVLQTIDDERTQIHAIIPRLMAGDATAVTDMQSISSDDINAQFDALGMITCGSGSN